MKVSHKIEHDFRAPTPGGLRAGNPSVQNVIDFLAWAKTAGAPPTAELEVKASIETTDSWCRFTIRWETEQ